MKVEPNASGIASQYSEAKLLKPDILIDIYTTFNHFWITANFDKFLWTNKIYYFTLKF